MTGWVCWDLEEDSDLLFRNLGILICQEFLPSFLRNGNL